MHIILTSNGYAVLDPDTQEEIFQGLSDFRLACELSELLEGERENEDDEV